MRQRRLIDNITNLTVNGASVETYGGHIKFLAGSSRYHALIRDFPDIIHPAVILRGPGHSTVDHIRTTPRRPVTSVPQRLASDRLRIAKSEFEEMPRNSAARLSDSPWSSPLHLVRMKEDNLRPCGDYRALNARTIPDQYHVRHIADFVQQHAGQNVFSTICLMKVCHHIPVNPDDIAKQPISLHSGFSNSRVCHSGSETRRKHFNGSSIRFSATWISVTHI